MIAAEPVPETLADRAATLFRGVQGGQTAMLDELVSLLTPIMWHTARAQRLDHETAEDVLQTTWLALVRNSDRIAEPQAVLQWLIVTTRRESWRVQRAGRRAEPRGLEQDDAAAPSAERPDEVVLRSDGDTRLWQHVSALPERCRALLRVVAFADRPDYAGVAQSLGMPVGSIGPTRGRCLAKLRSLLEADPTWEAS